MNFETLYDNMLDYGIVTAEELGVACHFGGCTVETLNELLFYKTGYRDFEQFEDYELGWDTDEEEDE